MRGKKRHLWLFALAMVSIMVSSSVRADIIAFSSDRAAASEHDVWLSRHDGSQQVLFSDTPNHPNITDHRSRPSICNDGQWIFYDDSSGFPEFKSELWVKKTSGVGQPQQVLDCTNPEGSPNCFNLPSMQIPWCPGAEPLSPPPLPTVTGGECGCLDVDCGPPASFFPSNPRILFTYGNSLGARENILMATWDATNETLGAPCKLTATGNGPPHDLQKNFEPAWCGSNHMVFSSTRQVFPPDENNEEHQILGSTICTMAIPAAGATEPPEFRCHDTDDQLDERYPSCGRKNNGEDWTVAYARQKTGAGQDTHLICTVELDQTTFDFIPLSERCTPDVSPTISWTKPTWSPGGTQIAFASNENVDSPGEVDYDIYRIGSDSNSLEFGGPIIPNTQNADEDDAPDWGPAVPGQ